MPKISTPVIFLFFTPHFSLSSQVCPAVISSHIECSNYQNRSWRPPERIQKGTNAPASASSANLERISSSPLFLPSLPTDTNTIWPRTALLLPTAPIHTKKEQHQTRTPFRIGLLEIGAERTPIVNPSLSSKVRGTELNPSQTVTPFAKLVV